MLGDDLAGLTHVALFEAAPQAVVDNRVDHLAVPEPESFAQAPHEIRRVAHRFHAAGDNDVNVFCPDGLIGQHHGL